MMRPCRRLAPPALRDPSDLRPPTRCEAHQSRRRVVLLAGHRRILIRGLSRLHFVIITIEGTVVIIIIVIAIVTVGSGRTRGSPCTTARARVRRTPLDICTAQASWWRAALPCLIRRDKVITVIITQR